jgi:hypothetical protein
MRLLAAAVIAYLAYALVLWHVDFARRDLYWYMGATALFAVALFALRRASHRGLSDRATVVLVLGVGATLQLVALTRAPLTSDDSFRYAWDAHVQFAGIDPYRYAPAAHPLAPLRTSEAFGQSSPCTYRIDGTCTAINRPTVHTIYPPVAQAAFGLGRLLSLNGHHAVLGYQILAALGSLGVAVLLVRRAASRRRPRWPVGLWAWSPVVVSEFGNNAHIDWLAVLLALSAMSAGAVKRDAIAGALIGLAVATKLYPVVVLPSLMRRRPWLVPLVAIATIAIVYLPHVVAVGPRVFGYLPGYLHEEGFASGTRLRLLGAVLPGSADLVAGAVILVAAALWSWRGSDPSAPEQTATVMVGVTLLVTTPAYGWYATILIALAVLSERYPWVVLAGAGSLVYLIHNDAPSLRWLDTAIYAVAGVVSVVGDGILHSRRARRRRPTDSSVDRGRVGAEDRPSTGRVHLMVRRRREA